VVKPKVLERHMNSLNVFPYAKSIYKYYHVIKQFIYLNAAILSHNMAKNALV